MEKAIFIDKDGTLVPDIPYNVDPAQITLAPGAGMALCQLKAKGYLLVVISNQSGIARGMFAVSALLAINNRLNALLASYAVALDGFYYCPHHPEGTVSRYAVECDCRKPKPGLLLNAARDLKIDLPRSWMVGDIWADTEAGNRAGCRTVLIEKPYDLQRQFIDQSRPTFQVTNWDEAVEIIQAADRGSLRQKIEQAAV
jgi:D-glycero-D-manno-heptose 1,7-bisphosphate phosphatase